MELEELAYDGYYVSDVLFAVKSGKEATVFCCKAQAHTGLEFAAAKVYRPLESRSFKNDAAYQQSRYIKDSRLRRAYANKSKAGKQVQFGSWISAEYETMRILSNAGADVPVPYNMTENAIIMEYFGTDQEPASMLNRVHLGKEEADTLFRKLMRNIEIFLSVSRVHADLSPFNILYLSGQFRIIDFPQSVDPYSNSNAYHLLARDIDNLCAYFRKYGLDYDSHHLANAIWNGRDW